MAAARDAPEGAAAPVAAAAAASAAAADAALAGACGVPAVHLVVVQHGLWGTPDNMCSVMEHLESTLQGLAGRERVVLENSGGRCLGVHGGSVGLGWSVGVGGGWR